MTLIRIKMMMLSTFILVFSLPYTVVSNTSIPYSSFSKIQLPPGLTGPESVAFDPSGKGPYVVVTDGRILLWQGPHVGFTDFATTSPQRTKQVCDGTRNPDLGPVCGRPLGLSFYDKTSDLYIADAYRGLLVVGPQGGLATQLASGAEGVPFRLTNGVDVDQLTGLVYFADSSTTFELRNITQANFVPDSTGRLMQYDPRCKAVKVLLRGIYVAVGPAVSFDSSFVVVSEVFGKRILRFWLTGPKKNTVEIFLNVSPGMPNKIKRTPLGDFWAAVNIVNGQPPQFTIPQGVKFNVFGIVLQTMNFDGQYYNTSINVIQEVKGWTLYVGSRYVNFAGVYSY